MNKERKQPTTLFAVVSFLVIIAVLIIMINTAIQHYLYLRV